MYFYFEGNFHLNPHPAVELAFYYCMRYQPSLGTSIGKLCGVHGHKNQEILCFCKNTFIKAQFSLFMIVISEHLFRKVIANSSDKLASATISEFNGIFNLLSLNSQIYFVVLSCFLQYPGMVVGWQVS